MFYINLKNDSDYKSKRAESCLTCQWLIRRVEISWNEVRPCNTTITHEINSFSI